MTTDPFRDNIDKSQKPYINGSKTDNITTYTEDFTRKKYLPLRQQSSKGILRYDQSTTKTVHFNQDSAPASRLDLLTIGKNEKKSLHFTHNVEVNSESKNASIPLPTRQFRMNTQNLDQNLITLNPYSRPVSVSEVAAKLQNGPSKYFVPTALTVSNLPEMSPVACTAPTLQRNLFLRPLNEASSNKHKLYPTWVGPNTSLMKQEHLDSIFLQKHNFPLDSTMTHSSSNISNEVSIKFANPSSPTLTENHINMESLSSKLFFAPSFAKKISQSSQQSVTPEELTHCIISGPYLESRGLLMKETSFKSDLPSHCSGSFPSIFCESSTPNTSSMISSNDESSSPSHLTGALESLSLKKMPVASTLTGVSYKCFSESKTRPNLAAENTNFSNIAWQNLHNQAAPSCILSPQLVSQTSFSTNSKSFLETSSNNVEPDFIPSTQETKTHGTTETLKNKEKINESNLNIFPTKVLSSVTADISEQTSKPPTSTAVDIPQQPTQILPGKISQNKNKSKTTILKNTALPVEQRSVGDGAPSDVKRMSETSKTKLEKGGVSFNTEEGDCDDADDDNAFNDSLEEEDNDEESKSNEMFLRGERLPGDGEANVDSCEDDDDNDIESFEDNILYTAVPDSYSKNCARSMSADSKTLIHALENKTLDGCLKSTRRPVTATRPVVVKPAFRFSLFNRIPPTINFVAEGEKPEPIPHELSRLMKWKMSSITPGIVKETLARVGFRITKKNHDWLGCFGKHMKSFYFKSLHEHQKLNHFPGSFQIGRKDKLWRSLSKLQIHYGKQEFNFFPQTFILPFDLKLLKQVWEEGHCKQKWIIKPPASARGRGICVISKWSQVPKHKSVIVQRYIHRPYLINASKFDMRIYVYVSCYDPLRLYVYDDGLARFASCKYSSSSKSLSNRFIHLTNYSVNKKNSDYLSNTDNAVCQGHKWSLKALWNYMKRQGINTNLIWETIRDLIIKTIISGDSVINSMTKSNTCSRYCCHELFGFDILLDEHFKPWILEVNISPSLHSNSPLDISIKGAMIKDMLNIAGFRLPDEHNGANSEPSTYSPSNQFCIDKRLFTNQLSPDERAKHSFYCQKYLDEQVLSSILNILTPDDVRILCESIDEDSRKGHFQRLFPTPSTHRYLRYFEQPRYYNLLLEQWVLRYNHREEKGIQLLQSLCNKGLHLQNPTTDPQHIWTVPLRPGFSLMKPLDTQGFGSKDSGHTKKNLKNLGQLLQSSTNNNSRHSLTSLTSTMSSDIL